MHKYTMENYNEDEITRQLQDPTTQRKAFEEVVKQYNQQLYWQIRRMVLSHEDANDILQIHSSRPGAILIISGARQGSLPGCIGLP